MNKGLYPRLALSNLRKNGRFVIPYILAGGGAVAMLYIVGMLAMDNGLGEMFAGYWVGLLMAIVSGLIFKQINPEPYTSNSGSCTRARFPSSP